VGRLARWLAVALVLAATSRAHAQVTTSDCHVDMMQPLTVSPSAGSTGAPLNAPVIVRYAAGYFDPMTGPGEPPSSLFRLVSCGTTCGALCDVTSGTEVPGLVQTQGDDLIFVPDDEFGSHTVFAGRATGLDGELDFSFCTGSGRDTSPPTAVPIASVTSTHVTGLSCLDDGYRIGVTAPLATDDGPAGSIEYLLFETRGQGIDEPTLVDRFRPSSPRVTLAFLLPSEAARTPICLQIVTVDGAGHAGIPNGEQCFDPVGRTTFVGCSAGGRGGSAAGAALACAAILLFRRRIR
jgi:hypothetical protein